MKNFLLFPNIDSYQIVNEDPFVTDRNSIESNTDSDSSNEEYYY